LIAQENETLYHFQANSPFLPEFEAGTIMMDIGKNSANKNAAGCFQERKKLLTSDLFLIIWRN
jgi:hypothetical protein